MKVTNDDGLEADLPDSLAQLLIGNRGWKKGRGRAAKSAPPHPPVEDDEAIPMTHLPGVVPGISMNRLKKLVGNGTIPHVLDGRTKLVKPSDVLAALEGLP